jgi:hypothetical protein
VDLPEKVGVVVWPEKPAFAGVFEGGFERCGEKTW